MANKLPDVIFIGKDGKLTNILDGDREEYIKRKTVSKVASMLWDSVSDFLTQEQIDKIEQLHNANLKTLLGE